MKSDVRKIRPGHLQHIVGIGEEHVAPHCIHGHELVFAFLERFQGGRIIAFYPACLIERNGFPTALRAIFMQQSVLNHLKLQLANRADDFASVELVGAVERRTGVACSRP